jgi:hypothetical protein
VNSLDFRSRAAVAEERGSARPIDGAEIGAVWADLAPGFADGPGPEPRLPLDVAGRPRSDRAGRGLIASMAGGGVDARLPPSRAEAMTFGDKAAGGPRERLAAERGEVAGVERERLGATAVAARRSVAAGAGRLYFDDTTISRSPLYPSAQTVRPEVRSLGVEVETATLRVGEAWASALPGPHLARFERNLDSASLAASLLHSASDLYEPAGHLYGRARATGAPIVLDRFAHESHNAIVLGQTGKGKTMFTGAEMARCFMRGIRVMGVDPLGDYRRLTDTLGGTYLELGASGGLNPFAMSGTDRGRLRGKLTSSAGWWGDGRRPSRDEHPPDRAIRATYEAAGIGPDPATQDRRARPRRSRRALTKPRRQARAPPRALGHGLAGRDLHRRRALPTDAAARHRARGDLRSRRPGGRPARRPPSCGI